MAKEGKSSVRAMVKKVFPLLDKLFFDWIANNFFIGMALFEDDAIVEDVMTHQSNDCAGNERETDGVDYKNPAKMQQLKMETELTSFETLGELFAVGETNPIAERVAGKQLQEGRRVLQGHWFAICWQQFVAPACQIAAEIIAENEAETANQVVKSLSEHAADRCAEYSFLTISEAIARGTAYAVAPIRWGEKDQVLLETFRAEVSAAIADKKVAC